MPRHIHLSCVARRNHEIIHPRFVVKAPTVLLSLLLAGCTNYAHIYVRVEDAVSKKPLASVTITTALYDPAHPELPRSRVRRVITGPNGIAAVRIPMNNTRSIDS